MERTYSEAAITLTLAIFTVISGYFTGFSTPAVYFMIISVCATFGFAAYISREGFNRASLGALLVLVFAVLGRSAAVFAAVAGIGTVLVSVFAGGNRFREYYGSTRIPLALIGVALSVAVLGMALNSTGFEKNLRNSTANFVGQEAERIINQSNIISSQKNKQAELIGATANSTITYTKAYVLNDTRDELSRTDIQAVNSAFSEARAEVTSRMSEQVDNAGIQIDISARIADVVSSQLSGKRFVIFIPFILSAVMLMQPVIGLLTATFAKVYEVGESRLL